MSLFGFTIFFGFSSTEKVLKMYGFGDGYGYVQKKRNFKFGYGNGYGFFILEGTEIRKEYGLF